MQNFMSRPPVDVLHDIFLLKKRKDKGEQIDLPLITIAFHNRQAISGFLMDMKKENTGAYHFSVEAEGSRDLVFAEAYYVQAVVIQEVKSIDYLLTDINASNAGDRKVVTRLEIKSKLAEYTKMLGNVFNKSIELQSEDTSLEVKDHYFLKQVVTDLTMCLLSIGEEEPGKSAIADTIDRIVFRKGDSFQIGLQDRTLIFTDTFSRLYSTTPQRAYLYNAITDVL